MSTDYADPQMSAQEVPTLTQIDDGGTRLILTTPIDLWPANVRAAVAVRCLSSFSIPYALVQAVKAAIGYEPV